MLFVRLRDIGRADKAGSGSDGVRGRLLGAQEGRIRSAERTKVHLFEQDNL